MDYFEYIIYFVCWFLKLYCTSLFLGIRVFNATFNNISVMSWLSVLMLEESGVLGEYHQPDTSHWQILSHNVVSSTPHLSGIRTLNFNGDRHWLPR
jgi:hypothetical protein